MSALLTSLALLTLQAKPETTPVLLPPALPEWRFERIDFPLPFAPALEYKGFEELAFSPGMFTPKSDTFFTYVFAMKIESDVTVDAAFLKNLLTEYFRGLCRTVSKQSQFEIDPSKITGTVTADDDDGRRGRRFRATLNSFDPFVTGEPLTLHLELVALKLATHDNRIYASVSPKPSDHAVWNVLRGIEKRFRQRTSTKAP